MSVPTAFEGEIQLRRWSESSTQGVQVTFALAESAELDRFKGLEGKRFMAVLVQIGDDEQPVECEKKRVGPYCYQAVKWCNDPEFQAWVRTQIHKDAPFLKQPNFVELFIKRTCGIDSRKELDVDLVSQGLWHKHIAGPYHKYLMTRGRVREGEG